MSKITNYFGCRYLTGNVGRRQQCLRGVRRLQRVERLQVVLHAAMKEPNFLQLQRWRREMTIGAQKVAGNSVK
jgi:hypothetical protein